MKTVTSAVPLAPSSAELALLTKAIVLGDGQPGEALAIAERLGMPTRVKAAVSPLMSGDTDLQATANSRTILTNFAAILRNTSAFFRLLDGGMMLRVPLRSRVSWMTGAPEPRIVNEHEVIGVRRFSTEKALLEPVKASGIIIFSEEILAWLSTAGEAWLSNELRRAIGGTVDEKFFAMITDGDTPTASCSGSNAIAAAVDLRFLFQAVGLTAESKPLLVMAPDVAINAATLIDAGMGFLFPGMSPTGGTMCNVPAIVTDALAAGELGLIDGAGIAGDTEAIEIRQARHATVQLDDSPDSPATASTVPTNLWAANLRGVMPQTYFAATRLRDSAFAKVTGVNWGSTDSPA